MALADDIEALRDRVLADLNAAHDYYTDTKIAWDIVGRTIADGGTFSIRNMTTGTVTTHVELAGKLRGYVADQLAEATFQQFIAIFENGFFDLVRLWLTAYPKNRPTGWFDYLEHKANLGCPTPDEIAKIAEAKASRDVLVHRRGVAGKTYESKREPSLATKTASGLTSLSITTAGRGNCFARSSPTSRTRRSRKHNHSGKKRRLPGITQASPGAATDCAIEASSRQPRPSIFQNAAVEGKKRVPFSLVAGSPFTRRGSATAFVPSLRSAFR